MSLFQESNRTKEKMTAEVRIKNKLSDKEQVINNIKKVYFEQHANEITVGLITPQGDKITVQFNK